MRFDGEDDVIKVPVETTTSYMISLWVNTACLSCGMFSLYPDSVSATPLNQAYTKNGNLCVRTSTTEMCTAGNGFSDEQWHHLVYANDGNTADLWVDGAIVNTITGGPAVTAAPNGQARLGFAEFATNDSFYGQLDDVRIYRYAQAADVITQIRQRAPLAMFQLDERGFATVFEDATTADWTLACSGDSCPGTERQGKLGNAVEFDGVDDRLSLGQPVLSSAAQSFSVGIWVNPNRIVNQAQTIWALPYDNNGSLKYAIGTAPNSLKLCVLTGASNAACNENSNVELVQNVWNYVVLTVERISPTTEHYQLYINGYLDSQADNTSTIDDGVGRLTVGHKPVAFGSMAGGEFGGLIDQVSFYQVVLNEIDVRDTFHYQMANVEESQTLSLVIDADAPGVKLVSFNPTFPYLSAADTILHVEASDPTSGIGLVEMQVEHRNLANPDWTTAPLCLDSTTDTAYCPTFRPDSGDGAYTLSFRAVDKVGHQSSTPQFIFYVDGEGPRITSDQSAPNTLLPGLLSRTQRNIWKLNLNGKLSDRQLGDGYDGSGVNSEAVTVTVFSQAGMAIGLGGQTPDLLPTADGYNWSIGYLLPELEPSGKLRVQVQAEDKVGNLGSLSFDILYDTTPARGRLDRNSVPEPNNTSADPDFDPNQVASSILVSQTLTGQVTDVPTETLPYYSPDGANAASGVSKVEVGFTPAFDVSYLFNEPYPAGLLAWLPLEYDKPPVDENGDPVVTSTQRLFIDLSPFQIAGVCEDPACPQAGIRGHRFGSIYFDGSGQVINLGQQVELANRSFTLSIWAKRAASGENHPFLWQGPSSVGSRRLLMGLSAENRFVCGFGGSDLVSSQTFSDTDWHHWACTFDLNSGQRTIYRDGQALASDSASALPLMYENLLIGLAPVGNYKGHLDELVIFGRALNAAEMRQHYTGANTVYHLGVEDNFHTGGDMLIDRSGFFQRAQLLTSDPFNKVAAGKFSWYGLKLDGDDRLVIDDTTIHPYALNLDRGAFTISAWISPTAGTGEMDIISQRDENPEHRYASLILAADRSLKVGFGDGYDFRALETQAGLVSDGAWNFVAVTFDGAVMRIFIDGNIVLENSSLVGYRPFPSTAFNVGENFNGMLDDVRIYPRSLTTLEIKALQSIAWRDAILSGDGNSESWEISPAPGLEGSYQVDVRGWDKQGHFDTDMNVNHQWGSTVDTLAPRIELTRTGPVSGSHIITYTFMIEDLMLDDSSIEQNICEDITITDRQYYNSAWYLLDGTPPNSILYRLFGMCTGDERQVFDHGISACDVGGNCASRTYPPYYTNRLFLPILMSGTASAADLKPLVEEPPPAPLKDARPLMESLAAPEGDKQAPIVAIDSRVIGQAQMRSMYHFNLAGRVYDDLGLARLRIEIYASGRLVYTTYAAIYGNRWNAMWVFPPGAVPANGEYRLVATAIDWAGKETTASQSITVQLTAR